MMLSSHQIRGKTPEIIMTKAGGIKENNWKPHSVQTKRQLNPTTEGHTGRGWIYFFPFLLNKRNKSGQRESVSVCVAHQLAPSGHSKRVKLKTSASFVTLPFTRRPIVSDRRTNTDALYYIAATLISTAKYLIDLNGQVLILTKSQTKKSSEHIVF